MFIKAIQVLVKLAPDALVRPTLAGLYFKGNKITVTDSFKLMEVTLPEIDITDLPASNTNFKFARDEEIDFIIPSKVISSIKIPKPVKGVDCIDKAYIGNIKGDTVGIQTNDLEKEVITQTRTIKSKFPDYESFFENKGIITSRIDLQHMIDTLTVFQKLGNKYVDLTFGEQEEPVLIKGDENEKGTKSRAIIMPLKIINN